MGFLQFFEGEHAHIFTDSSISDKVYYYQSIVMAKPLLQVRAPNLTFTERLEFHGKDRTAELIAFGGGHTEGDAVLFLP